MTTSVRSLVTKRRRRPLPSPAERRRLRETHELTLADMGELTGVKAPTVCRWELGTREPRGLLRDRYCQVLTELANLERVPDAG